MPNVWLQRRVLGYAHQGGALEAPPSTFYAIQRAVEIGIDAVELDLHLSRDGVIVVNHDDVVDDCSDGKGRISDLDFVEISRLDAAYHFIGLDGGPTFRGLRSTRPEFRFVRLEEILEAFPSVIWNFDLKEDYGEGSQLETKLVELLGRYGAVERTVVGSFLQDPMDRLRLVGPEVSTSATPTEALSFYSRFVGGSEPLDTVPYVALQVPDTLGGSSYLRSELVDFAHIEASAVHVWTVDDAATMQTLIDLGCDGIISDRPSLLLEKLRNLGVQYAG